MTFFTGPAGSVSYTYNANRQPVGMAYRLGESTVMEERLTYDRTGRITSSERTGSSPELTGSADYGYDSNELMVYETGAGSIRSVFGHSYECLSETVTSETQAAGTETASGSPVPEKTRFLPDMYGSPLFAAGEGADTIRYTPRSVWGNPLAEADSLSGPGGSLRFTSYHYDPVIGKYFAQARFYDGSVGRMLGRDPVKRGLNPYPYCGNDPADYVDPTGEVANILGGAAIGGVVGGAFGFAGSAISQVAGGRRIDWKKAAGAGVNGAVVGAVRGALVGSGAGVSLAFASNFAAGAAGSALEQYIVGGSASVRKSLTSGLTNAVSGAIYGTGQPGSLRSAFGRGFGAGAARSGIEYLSETLDRPRRKKVKRSRRRRNGLAGRLPSSYAVNREPRRGCGSYGLHGKTLGYSRASGYRYQTPRMQSQSSEAGFRMGDFIKAAVLGGVMEGLGSAAFYGAGKAVEALGKSIRSNRGGSKTINVSIVSPFDLQATHSQTLSKKNMNKLIDDIKNNGISETIKYVEHNGQKY